MKPVEQCVSCVHNNSCGMCRLMPLLHGYPQAFGFKDCREFMNRVAAFHERQLTSPRDQGATTTIRQEGRKLI